MTEAQTMLELADLLDRPFHEIPIHQYAPLMKQAASTLRATIPADTQAMREALEHYAKHYCEGWCKDAPSQAMFDDCGGCKARTALAATGYKEIKDDK